MTGCSPALVRNRLHANKNVADGTFMRSFRGKFLTSDSPDSSNHGETIQQMLPDIPKTKKELLKRITLEIRHYTEARVPIMSRARSLAQHEGDTHSYERFDAPPVSEPYQEHAAKVEVRMDEVPTLVNEQLGAKIRQIGEDMTLSLTRMFTTTLEKVTDEVGNRVDASGKPFSKDMYVGLLERMMIDFDDNGRPTFEIYPPSLAAKLVPLIAEWMKDAEFRERITTLSQQKVMEWRDRESHRKLVD